MDEDSVVGSQDRKTVRDEKHAKHDRSPSSVADTRSKLWYATYAGSILVMYNVLVQILRWKYRGKTQTCFETQPFLTNTSIISFLIAGLTLTLSLHFYITSTTRNPFSPVVYSIIKFVFFVSAVIAHLSIVLILVID